MTRQVLVLCLAMVVGVSMAWCQTGEEKTFGCEANPTGDPVGGGEGYSDIFTSGDFTATTDAELLAAFEEAEPGDVIYIPDGAEIDLTEHGTITIPGGIIIAGSRGLDGSPGAKIFSHRQTGTCFVIGGDDVRLTGLRFEGPSDSRERTVHSATFVRIARAGLEVDNCEIYNWNIQGIYVQRGAFDTYVHHNYIHHCQRSGYGYGVVLYGATARIIGNMFDYCRHHIAAGGHPGSGYEAAYNLVLENANGHNFDMHGGRDRGDGTDIAGDYMHIHHNTFRGPHRAVVIRGVPSQWARIHHNWFNEPVDEEVRSGGNTQVYSNVYGPEKTLEE